MNNNVFNSIFPNEIACKGKDVRSRYYIEHKKGDTGIIQSTVKGPEDIEIIFCDHR